MKSAKEKVNHESIDAGLRIHAEYEETEYPCSQETLTQAPLRHDMNSPSVLLPHLPPRL
jgi:hypothetical protein